MGREGKGERVMLRGGMRMILCEWMRAEGDFLLGGDRGGAEVLMIPFLVPNGRTNVSISANFYRLGETCHESAVLSFATIPQDFPLQLSSTASFACTSRSSYQESNPRILLLAS